MYVHTYTQLYSLPGISYILIKECDKCQGVKSDYCTKDFQSI